MKKNKQIRYLISFAAVIISALIQTFVIQTFIQPSNLLSSGFTGVAILIDKIAALYNTNIPVSISVVVLNVPVAFMCVKSISKKFTFFSLIQVFLLSIFLRVFSFSPIFEAEESAIVLNVLFGGFLYGLGTVIALKGNASTGGTDFIALFISNKLGKSIWEYVFAFNVVVLCIFGFMFGWIYAGYSILFQFVATKTISTLHRRYDRYTLQVTTAKASEIIDAYIKEYHHGISCIDAIGGYSKMNMYLLHTVVSSYEVNDIVHLMREIDPKVIINMIKTEQFYGKFYQQPIS